MSHFSSGALRGPSFKTYCSSLQKHAYCGQSKLLCSWRYFHNTKTKQTSFVMGIVPWIEQSKLVLFIRIYPWNKKQIMCSLECSHEPNKAHYLLRGNIVMKTIKQLIVVPVGIFPWQTQRNTFFFFIGICPWETTQLILSMGILQWNNTKQISFPWDYPHEKKEQTKTSCLFIGIFPWTNTQMICSWEYSNEATKQHSYQSTIIIAPKLSWFLVIHNRHWSWRVVLTLAPGC